MRLHLLSFALLCLCCAAMHASEISPEEVKLISATAVQWLAFDEWGRTRPDDPYPGNTGKTEQRLREVLQKHPDNILSIIGYTAEKPVLSASYDPKKHSFESKETLPPERWDSPHIHIRIAAGLVDRWSVSIEVGQTLTNIKIAHDEHGYYVSAFEETWILD